MLCRSAVAAAESGRRVPDGFLAAIARVESGRADPSSGTVSAWPWTVNAEGMGAYYGTKEEAVAAVRALQARGVRSIDVGCLQVNLMHHPEAFASLEQAFDPLANAAYAADFLVSLFTQTGSWPLAAAAYHSQTPTLGAAYQKRVLAEWAVPAGSGAARREGSSSGRAGHAVAAQATLFPALAFNGAALAQTTRPGGTSPFGRVGAMMTQPAPMAHASLGSGRGLAAYRLLPTQMAARFTGRRG
jgi:hypothetical protein